MSQQISLIHCRANTDYTQNVARSLSKMGVQFHLISCSDGMNIGEQLTRATEKVLLFISDNFLREISCMNNSVEWFAALHSQDRVMTVVIPGEYHNNGHPEQRDTNLSKVANVIKYMNFWQDNYLSLRKEFRAKPQADAFKNKLESVRQISSEVGEFLRLVRSSNFYTISEFRNDNFKIFADWLDLPPNKSQLETDNWWYQPIEDKKSKLPTTDYNYNKIPKTIDSSNNITHETQIALTLESVEDNDMVQAKNQENTTEVVHSARPTMPIDKSRPKSKFWDAATEAMKGTFNFNIPIRNLIEIKLDDDHKDKNDHSQQSIVANSKTDIPLVEPIIIQANDTKNSIEEVSNFENNKILINQQIQNILANSKSLLQEKNIPGALNTLNDGVEKFPKESNLRYYYAFVLAKYANNISIAQTELEIVLLQSPMHIEAHFLMGELAEEYNDIGIAKDHYSRVLSIQPIYPLAHFRIGKLFDDKIPNSKDAALSHYKLAIKQDPSFIKPIIRAAQIFETELIDFENAHKYWKNAHEIQPENSLVLLHLAQTAAKLGDKTLTQQYYKLIKDIDSDYVNQEIEDFIYPNIKNTRPTIGAYSNIQNHENLQESEIIGLKRQITLLKSENLNLNGQVEDLNQQLLQKPPKIFVNTRTILITGATSGIGLATANLLAEQGHNIIITGRRQEKLQTIQKHLSEKYLNKNTFLHFDVRQVEYVQQALAHLPIEFQDIDILINNAGLAKGLNPIHKGNLAHWEQMIDTNIKGLLYLTRIISPQMVAKASGHIINVASTAAHEVYPNGNVYNATKYAVNALTQGMRLDLYKHGIKVSQVSPGHVETEFALVRFDGDKAKSKIYEDFMPLQATDVARAIRYIISQPKHVNIHDIILTSAQQASSTLIDRSGR